MKHLLTLRGAATATSILWFSLLAWFSFNPMYTGAALLLLLLFLLGSARFRGSQKVIGDLSCTRRVSAEEVFVRKPLPVTLTVKNNGRRTTDVLRIIDPLPDSFKITAGNPSATCLINPGEAVTLQYTVEPEEVGEYIISSVSLTMFDKLRLFWVGYDKKCETKLQVYPSTQGMDTGPPGDSRLFHFEISRRATRRKGIGSEFYSLREYNPGDDFRLIAWKAMAKSPVYRPMTLQHEDERNVRFVLALDTSPDMVDGPVGGRKLDDAIDACFAFAYACLAERDVVSIVYKRDGRVEALSDLATRTNLKAVLRALAALRPTEQDCMEDMADYIFKTMGRRSYVIFITDMSYPKFPRLDLLKKLQMKGHRVYVLVPNTVMFLPTTILRTEKAVVELLERRERDHLSGVAEEISRKAIPMAVYGPRELRDRLSHVHVLVRQGR